MQNELLYDDDREGRERAARAVNAGGVIAFRTDTFYGLGANPFNEEAVRRVNELKGREGKPILVLVSDVWLTERLFSGGAETPLFRSLSRKFWPGPLTLVVPAEPLLPPELTAGTGTVGVRLPDDDEVRSFVRACGGALTATSANRAGEPPAYSAGDVRKAFPAGLSLIVNGGEARTTKPSTVVNVCGARPELIREGVVPWFEIERAAGKEKR